MTPILNSKNIATWRANWKSKKNQKLLSIVGIRDKKAIILEAIKRSYSPSVKNTALKQGNYGSKKLQSVRTKGCNLLVKHLILLFDIGLTYNNEEFGKWEEELAIKLRLLYQNNGISTYTFGNAQKWINMAIKYIFSADSTDWRIGLFNACYLPIDRTVMSNAKKEFGLKPLSKPWSKCDDWEEIKKYQEDLEKKIVEKYPNPQCSRLWWECNIW